MEELTCKICGKIFRYKKIRYCRARLAVHLKEHNISKEDYIVKYELNGMRPTCACGCGTPCTLKHDSWEFNRYAQDSHVGKVHSAEAQIIKDKMILARKKVWDEKEYYTNRYDESFVMASSKDFLSKLYTLSELEEKYQTDKRTMQKAWFAFNVVTPEEYRDITNYFKYTVSKEKQHEKYEVPENIYAWAYLFIKEHPKKYTVNSIVKEYNKNRISKINVIPQNFYKQLKNIYGDEVDLYFAKGCHSSEEYKFYEVLSFYFPKSNIDLGFKLGKCIYDFCIDNKVIIEYDSEGFFHAQKHQRKKDKEKEVLANKRKYIFLRANKEEIHDINFIKQIQECLNL